MSKDSPELERWSDEIETPELDKTEPTERSSASSEKGTELKGKGERQKAFTNAVNRALKTARDQTPQQDDVEAPKDTSDV